MFARKIKTVFDKLLPIQKKVQRLKKKNKTMHLMLETRCFSNRIRRVKMLISCDVRPDLARSSDWDAIWRIRSANPTKHYNWRNPFDRKENIFPFGNKAQRVGVLYFKDNEIFPVPELVEAVEPKTYRVKKKETFEEALKTTGIPGRYIFRSLPPGMSYFHPEALRRSWQLIISQNSSCLNPSIKDNDELKSLYATSPCNWMETFSPPF